MQVFMHFKGGALNPMLIKPQNAMEELKIEPLLFRVHVEWNTKGEHCLCCLVMHRFRRSDNKPRVRRAPRINVFRYPLYKLKENDRIIFLAPYKYLCNGKRCILVAVIKWLIVSSISLVRKKIKSIYSRH